MTLAPVLAVLVQETEKDGGIGQVLLFALLVLVIVAVVGCILMLLPILIALRHGWRWTLATLAVAWLAGFPLRLAYDSDEITESSWGLISFPLWIAVAVIAWRGPPKWFPGPRGRASTLEASTHDGRL